MKKKIAAPAEPAMRKGGLDYTPQRGGTKDVAYGVALRTRAGRIQTAHEIVAKRLENFEPGAGRPLERRPTCARHDILLPPDAADRCGTYRGLCDHFEEQALPHQRDLIAILTLRFQHRDTRHRIWERSRSFLMERIVIARELPVVMALHIPSIASRPLVPHVHALIFLRQLPGPDFSAFDRELTGPDAKQLLAAEWHSWPDHAEGR